MMVDGWNSRKNSGSIAFEYLLVSIFAAVVGMAFMGFAAKLTAEQLEKISAKAGVDLDLNELMPWFDMM